MKRNEIIGLATVLGIFAVTFVVYGIPVATAFPLTTTITGWNIPSANTLSIGLIPLLLPLATMGIFAGIPLALEQRGSFVVTMAFAGLLIGSILGMLSLNGSNPGLITFALPVTIGIFLVLHLWKGE